MNTQMSKSTRSARPAECKASASSTLPRRMRVQLGSRTSPHIRGAWTLARASPVEPTTTEVQESPAAVTDTTQAVNGNGVSSAPSVPPGPSATPLELTYQAPSDTEAWWTKFKLAFALLWRRFPNDSVLTIKLEGELSDQSKGWIESGNSVPQVCAALQRAALDPRVAGLAIEIGPLSVGYAKLQELRRHLEYFRASGKFSIAYMKQGGEKEYYLASACQEIYVPPSASVSLRGFVVGGTFLRGVLDKVGVEPQVQRIGQYKSAGDQLLRRDMSTAQQEQLEAILNDTYSDWVSTIAKARGKTEDEVRSLLDAGLYDAADLVAGGWLDGLRYEDEVLEDIKKRTGVPADKLDKPLKKVGVRKLNSVRPSSYGPALARGKKRIVVLRTSGAILGKASGTGGSITPDMLIPRLRALGQNKQVVGVVLRVDSPGGDALASDLMWREVAKLAEKKPVIASMGDVAASGGYYIAMAANKIVAEPLTVTGSIGVVTGKFNLQELYGRIGYAKKLLSKGRYAELLADQRPFTEDEQQLFERSALNAYESFRNKAAASRKLAVEAMQEVAQGRVWTGRAALERGLVDALGGVHTAVQLVRQAAGLEADERVTVVEMGTSKPSPLALLRGGATAAMFPAALNGGSGLAATLGLLLAPLLAAGTGAAGAGAVSAEAAAVAARVAGAGLDTALGSSTAAAVAAAAGSSGVLGGAYCIEPEALGVQAAGSMAVAAAAGLGASAGAGAPVQLRAPWDDESFLHE